jgi:AcrR family transcriptional regulator
MARPRSEDKRQAILAAATQVFAEAGLNAPTARIARAAGVAEGTLFTYFPTKDDLLNQLYLELKGELRALMMPAYPAQAGVREQAHHAWRVYVRWGSTQLDKRRVLAQLGLSERLSEATRAAGMQAFCDLNALLAESVQHGVLGDQPPAFVAAVMGALAETTMDFIVRDPAQAERTSEAGFEAFWNAISKP